MSSSSLDCRSVKTCAPLCGSKPASPDSVRDILSINLEEYSEVVLGQRKKGSRRVSFDTDRNGNIKLHVAKSAKYVLTEQDKKVLWWSKREINDIVAKLRQITLYYQEKREDYKADFLHLFFQCLRSPIMTEEDRMADQRGRRSARGLERHINEILPHYRNRFVETILDIQSKMPPNLDPDIKARLLRAKCSNLSKPSRNLARFLAYQDEIEVSEALNDKTAIGLY